MTYESKRKCFQSFMAKVEVLVNDCGTRFGVEITPDASGTTLVVPSTCPEDCSCDACRGISNV